MSPFQVELAKCFTNVMYVAECQGISGKGDISYAEPKRVECYIEFDSAVPNRSDREELMTRDQIICIEPVGRQDMIWYEGKTPGVKAQGRKPHKVEPMYDPETKAISHYEVTI